MTCKNTKVYFGITNWYLMYIFVDEDYNLYQSMKST